MAKHSRPKPLTVALSKAEQAAIKALHRVAAIWPKTLWLFSASGSLCVMRTVDGERVMTAWGGGVDQAFIVDKVDIPNDGGDW